MTLAEKISFLRRSNGLSQDQLAEKLNVSRQAISRWESGAIPDMENILRLSRYFDCSIDYLFDNDKDLSAPAPEKGKSQEQKEQKKRLSPETLCLILIIISLIASLIIWVVSLFVDVDIRIRDTDTGMWYIGFGAFLQQYRITPLLFLLAATWFLCASIRIYYQLFVRRGIENRKYAVARITSWVLYTLGTSIWCVYLYRPLGFVWWVGAYVASGIYVLVVVLCLILAKRFKEVW